MGENGRTKNLGRIRACSAEEYRTEKGTDRCGSGAWIIFPEGKAQARSDHCSQIIASAIRPVATLRPLVGSPDIPKDFHWTFGFVHHANV